MNVENVLHLYEMYRELQRYVGWTADDVTWITQAHATMAPAIPQLIDDFYEEILRHPNAAAVITGGQSQINRLKQTLRRWLDGLFCGNYGEEFVRTRWNVGRRHVEIGLEQSYATAALARLRSGIMNFLQQNWNGTPELLCATERSINKLLDLDIAIIEMAYQQHFVWKLEEQALRQSQQTERLAAIGQMVTGLAHESRNLLQRSHACLEALILDIGDRPDALKQAGRIESALDQLHGLYEEVRNYAAPIKLELSEVDLHKLIQQSWQHLEPKWIDRDTHFEIRCSGNGPYRTRADSHRLDQVFTNIFQNALDACGDSPRIVCKISTNETDKNYRISISDNGSGIPDEVIDRIFQPFFTTKPQGTGLGMAISQRIVEAHGGTITARHNPTGGAEFQLRVPMSSAVLAVHH
jgi:signal transduction histidine kinase